jgi:hypothetical protein
MLRKAKKLYVDATFDIVSEPFKQLFTIQVPLGDSHKTVPVVYALMPGKNTNDYLKIFEFLKVNLKLLI